MAVLEKYCKLLELDKILLELSEYTCCDYAAQKVMEIKPSSDIEIIKGELLKVNDAFYLVSHYGNPTFLKMNNPYEHLKLAKVGGILTSGALLNMANILRQARMLIEWKKQSINLKTSLDFAFEQLVSLSSLENRIKDVFISEDEIDDHASEELYNIRRKIRQSSAKIKDNLDKMIRSSTYQKMLQDNIVTMRDGRYVVPVKAEYKSAVSGLVHDTSSSGATLFIEPMAAVELNNEIKVLQSKEKAEIERILLELSAACGEYSEVIYDNFERAVALNIYFAKSYLAVKMNANMPQINTNGVIDLKNARHPLISKDKIVPVDIKIGGEYNLLVITGPNTGGKTVTLKTTGLLSLMTMCGMLIPVSEGSVISVFDKILVDIGDEQSIAQSLSTFSAHMTNIVSILDQADEHSLVLVDELGSGTDPVEGAAIATAILEKLKDKGAIVAATTHYAELKVYALQTPHVMNASCEFDVKTLRPTYRLLIGTPGRSNAFEISKKLGLSEDILQSAKELIANDKKSFEDVIENLENSRQDYENETIKLKEKTQELENLRKKLSESNTDAILEKEKIIEKAKEEAQRIVERVKLDSQVILDELDKIRKQKDKEDFSSMALRAKAQIRGKIDRLHNEANPVRERSNEGYVLPRKLKPGDTVLLVDIDKQGYVLEEPKKDTVLVQVGIIKSRVAVSNLRLTDSKKVTIKGASSKTITSNKDTKASMDLDLRGMTVEEALMEVDMFINRSLLSNIGQITIIHGKGTGALRSAVHSYLKQSKYVKSFRLGVFGEGENGVTIAQLK